MVAAVEHDRFEIDDLEAAEDAALRRSRIPASMGAMNSLGIEPPTVLFSNE